MTQNRRIVLNIVATYGRSLYALVIGLFCGRWTLQALGEVDYGLLGVIGGMIGFVSFFNNLMAGAVGRFYAFAVGSAMKSENEGEGIELCRRWFSIAFMIHSVISISLTIIGYPIGVWAVENYLQIPVDKIEPCIWVWRMSCFSCFVGMFSVPFSAMYSAKQEIAELTIYGFATTTLNAIFLYYMISRPGFWLVKYTMWFTCLVVTPQLLIVGMALFRFKECRIRRDYLWDISRMRELFVYATGRCLCALAQVFRGSGMAVLVNKLLGPTQNAAITIGNTVVGHAITLTASCKGAMYPAITNAAGKGDFTLMRTLAFRMCKLASAATLLFALPLLLECDNVLCLWLKHPPAGASVLCALVLISEIVDHLTDGHWMSIFACGRVTMFNLNEALGIFIGCVISAILMLLGLGIASVGYGLIAGHLYALLVKIYFGRKLCNLSARYWFQHVVVPVAFVIVVSLCFGAVPRTFLPESVIRLSLTCCLTFLPSMICIWFFLFDYAEKKMVLDALGRILRRH